MSEVELESEMEWEEDTPFLAHDEREQADAGIEPEAAPTHGQPREPLPTRPLIRAAPWQAKTPGTIVFLAAVMKFCITSSGMLLLIPVYRLLEDALCHVYYEDDSYDIIDEMKCKVDDVQSRLASLIGWCGLFNSVMTLLVTFPYGMLADRIGRKPTAVLAYVGLAISFSFTPLMFGVFQDTLRRNPYIIMTASLWILLGGGVPVLLNTLYAVAADVSTEQQKAASFLYLTFGATLGGLIGPLLAGVLMTNFGPWVPVYVALTVTPFMLCVFFFIPETLNVETRTLRNKDQTFAQAFKEHVGKGLDDLMHSVDMIKNINIPLLLLTFFFQSARFAAYTSVLAQYISKHFGWKLAETSLLLSPLGVLNLIILVALPKLSEILVSRRFKFTVFGKDLFLTQASTFLIILGALIEAFSHNVILFLFGLFIGTFGAADSPLARATVSHYVDAKSISKLYALIGMMEVSGSFIAGPVLAKLFNIGLERKGIFIGLPWFYMAFLCGIAFMALLFVRPPPGNKGAGDETFHREPGVVNESTTEDPLCPE
ncbi:hypothetical protein MAC_02098 [Metarhizium acridum CQMa 102]|uniref:Major facilitator superfamily (MFS) profile domain-containing protein n=2 Tax=Metarhizium acridum TaxID=92637 RepID=E9DWV0_METAQ|nr:uncharacterized protein MAC_02098 [Metarhizium acridum CQMa 102]EFY91813.1 hypothetical protein MAC_02098 [Metarhizium acridum CQMa 102]